MLILFIFKIRDPVIDTSWSQVGEQIVYKIIEQVGGPIWNSGGYQLWESIIDILRQRKEIKHVKKFVIEQSKTILIYFSWNEMIWQIWCMIWVNCGCSDKTLELVLRIGFEWLVYIIAFPKLEKCYYMIKERKKNKAIRRA
jgi:hypothetical protein